MEKAHWVQTAVLVATLSITCGGMLASGIYFVISHIDGVAQADQQARMEMDRRITTLETEHNADETILNRLTVLSDQERAAEEDLATSISALKATIEHFGRR